MMKTLHLFGAALLTANCVVANASSADCVNRDDLSALKTAAMQQELMVAALTCHDVRRYNRFVVSHQDELIDSDNRLKAFFIRRGGEARYHTFKTELANAASLRSSREADSFCADARDRFDLAERPISLAAFVAQEPVALGGPYRACREDDRDAPLTADTFANARRRHADPDAESRYPDERRDNSSDDNGDN